MRMVILFVLSLLVGCSARNLVVKNADHILVYQITKRLPLHSGQKDILRKEIDQFLIRTKPQASELLPVIAELSFEKDKLQKQYKTLESLYIRIGGEISDILAHHLAKLDLNQQKEMLKTLRSENREMKKKTSDEIEEKIQERLEQILGSITRHQKKLIKNHLPYFITRNSERFERRENLHKKFQDIYHSSDPIHVKTTSFKVALMDYQEETIRGNKNLELLLALAETLSKSQKETLKDHLKEARRLITYFLSIEY